MKANTTSPLATPKRTREESVSYHFAAFAFSDSQRECRFPGGKVSAVTAQRTILFSAQVESISSNIQFPLYSSRPQIFRRYKLHEVPSRCGKSYETMITSQVTTEEKEGHSG